MRYSLNTWKGIQKQCDVYGLLQLETGTAAISILFMCQIPHYNALHTLPHLTQPS